MGSLFNFSPCREGDWRRQATNAENEKGKGKEEKQPLTLPGGKKIPLTHWQQPVEEAVGKEASRIRCPL